MKFFHLSVRLTNEKPGAFVCPFDKPIKSLYFRSFVVSVLFARFHFKVIRKSLYPFCHVLLLLAGMEWSGVLKTWSDEICFTTPRFITPCFTTPRLITPSFITPLHNLPLQSIPDFIECHFYCSVDHNGVTDLLFPNYL